MWNENTSLPHNELHSLSLANTCHSAHITGLHPRIPHRVHEDWDFCCYLFAFHCRLTENDLLPLASNALQQATRVISSDGTGLAGGGGWGGQGCLSAVSGPWSQQTGYLDVPLNPIWSVIGWDDRRWGHPPPVVMERTTSSSVTTNIPSKGKRGAGERNDYRRRD